MSSLNPRRHILFPTAQWYTVAALVLFLLLTIDVALASTIQQSTTVTGASWSNVNTTYSGFTIAVVISTSGWPTTSSSRDYTFTAVFTNRYINSSTSTTLCGITASSSLFSVIAPSVMFQPIVNNKINATFKMTRSSAPPGSVSVSLYCKTGMTVPAISVTSTVAATLTAHRITPSQNSLVYTGTGTFASASNALQVSASATGIVSNTESGRPATISFTLPFAQYQGMRYDSHSAVLMKPKC